MTSRRAVLAGLAAAPLAAVVASAQTTGPRPAIRLASINLSFYRVVGAIVAQLLEARGYAVSMQEGPHDQLFPRLGAGDFDLFTAAWLPNGHGPLWGAHGAQLETIAPLYDGARFFLAVPASVPQAEVGSIADLAKPDVAARMNKTIQALGPAAGVTRLSISAVERYRLADAGYQVKPGDAAQWRAAVDAAARGDTWAVAALWTPLFTDRLPFRPLADPLGAFGSPDTAYLVAYRPALSKLDPETLTLLRALRIPREDVSALDAEVVLQGRTPQDAARAWLAAHPQAG